MTEQISESIQELKTADEYCVIPSIKSRELAIRSLQAWEEILQELEEERDRFNRCNLNGEVIGIVSAIEVINQKLAEIEE